MAKNTQKKGALGMFEDLSSVVPSKPAVKEPEKNPATVKKEKKESVKAAPERTIDKIDVLSDDIPARASKNRVKKESGRPNLRGQKGKDFYMLNIAVPKDIHDKLKDKSMTEAAGNMTYLINKILKDAVQ